MFTQADLDFLKSFKISCGDTPVAETKEPDPILNEDEEKLVARLLHKIMNAPESVPLEALEPLGDRKTVRNILHGLNDYGMIFWSQKKQGFFTNPKARPAVKEILHRNGLD